MYELVEEQASRVVQAFCKRRFRPKAKSAVSCEDDSNASFSSVVVDEVGGCCDACSAAPSFEAQMSAAGPAKLYRVQMSSFDTLVMLGLFSARTEAAVLEACDLSTASFDVESLTIGLDAAAGREGQDLDVPTVSAFRLPRAAVARQVPILVSWIDQLALRDGAEPYVYEAEEAGPEKMVEKFVESLFERKEASVAAKRAILAELTDFLGVMRKAHFDFFSAGDDENAEDKEDQRDQRHRPDGDDGDQEEEEEEAEEDGPAEPKKGRWRPFQGWMEEEGLLEKKHRHIARAWEGSILGTFEAHLEALIRGFYVWGFNCEAS
jgi:hypothetical protein